MNDHSDTLADSPEPPMDNPAVLESLLDLGGPDMRAALGAQLTADFERLRATVMDDDGAEVARAAHELKGLAATVGAHRLAALAAALDPIADSISPGVRRAMAAPLQYEIDRILERLAQHVGGAPR